MFVLTALSLLLLALMLAARAGAVKGGISPWTSLLQPFFIILVAAFAVGFLARAAGPASFEWYHAVILAATWPCVILAAADVIRVYRETRPTTDAPEDP